MTSVPDMNAGSFDAKVALLRRDGRIMDYPSIGVGRDGRQREISISAETVLMEDVPHLVVYIIDITERTAAERALREREEIFRSIVSHAQDGICMVDPETLRFLEINDAGLRGLGYTRDEFSGKTLADIQAIMSDTDMRQAIERIMTSGTAFEVSPEEVDNVVLYAQQDPDKVDMAVLKERFLTTIALEAARVMEEGIVTDPREADVGSILAFGFAPYTGGTLSYVDGMGAKAFLEMSKRLQKKHGAQFKAPRLLIDMAAKGETFYERFNPYGGRKAA